MKFWEIIHTTDSCILSRGGGRNTSVVEIPAFHAEDPGFNHRSGQRKKRKAGSHVITYPTSPLPRVGHYKA